MRVGWGDPLCCADGAACMKTADVSSTWGDGAPPADRRTFRAGVAGAFLVHLLALLALAPHPPKTPSSGFASSVSITLVSGPAGVSAAAPQTTWPANTLDTLSRRLSQASSTPAASTKVRRASLDDLMTPSHGSNGGASPSFASPGGGDASDPYAHASGAKLAEGRQLQSALRMSSDRCWHRPNLARPVRLRVSLDSAGALRGQPLVLGGGAENAESARRAIAAVTGCAPFDLPILQGRPQTVDLDF